MRILIVSQLYWPESFRINDVAAGLVERGHSVTVLTGLPNYPGGRIYPGYGWSGPAREEHDGVEILRVPLVPRGRGGGVRLAINYLSFVLSACLLWPARLRGRFDAMLVFEVSPVTVGLPAAMIRAFKRVPMTFWIQDLWPESLSATGAIEAPWILRLVRSMVRFIYARCDEVLIQSRAFRGNVERDGVAADRIHYLPNSAESFYRILPRAECSAEDAELPRGFRVVFAGNLGAAQDLGTLVRAAEATRHRPDVQWIVFGDGRDRATLEREIAARGLGASVHLMGSRPPSAMPGYFAVADAMLVTLRRSPIFALTIPSKVQSYLACGRPVIAGLDGEGASVVEEAGAGLSCPAESPDALAAAVLRLRDMPEAERARMGRAGRAYFEREFDRELLLGRLESILAASAAGRRQ